MHHPGANAPRKCGVLTSFRTTLTGRANARPMTGSAANYDVQLHIGESRDSGSGANAPSRNDDDTARSLAPAMTAVAV
jgi:hypothetical protein